MQLRSLLNRVVGSGDTGAALVLLCVSETSRLQRENAELREELEEMRNSLEELSRTVRSMVSAKQFLEEVAATGTGDIHPPPRLVPRPLIIVPRT